MYKVQVLSCQHLVTLSRSALTASARTRNFDLVDAPWYCRVLNALQVSKTQASATTTQRPTVAMDYNFYGTSQQPYQYLGMPVNAYANTGIDPEAMRSVVSALVRPFSTRCCCGPARLQWPTTSDPTFTGAS